MAKLLLILFIALLFESTGIVLLKKGISQIGEVAKVTPAEVVRVIVAGATNGQIWLGMFFEALFFFGLLMLMSKSDISFLWPLTALSFVFATVAAMLFLHEHVSAIRWAGVVLIMIGAALISYSKHAQDQRAAPAPAEWKVTAR